MVISQHEGRPSGIVVHYVSTEVAPLKALYIFCTLKGYGRGPFIGFILVEKNSGRYLTMFLPKVVDFVENVATDFLNLIKLPYFLVKKSLA